MEEKLNGIRVVRKYHESSQQLMRRFRKKYMKSGILIDIREGMYYRKPSEKKKRKTALARLRRIREQKKLNLKPTNKRKGRVEHEIDYGSDRQDYSRHFESITD